MCVKWKNILNHEIWIAETARGIWESPMRMRIIQSGDGWVEVPENWSIDLVREWKSIVRGNYQKLNCLVWGFSWRGAAQGRRIHLREKDAAEDVKCVSIPPEGKDTIERCLYVKDETGTLRGRIQVLLDPWIVFSPLADLESAEGLVPKNLVCKETKDGCFLDAIYASAALEWVHVETQHGKSDRYLTAGCKGR